MTLLLDPNIRDWVVLPLLGIMIVTGLLRQSISILFMNSKTKIPVVSQRGQYLCKQISKWKYVGYHYMSYSQFSIHYHMIISHLEQEIQSIEQEKKRKEEEGDQDAAAASSSDPMADMMANPMKMMGGNMFFMVQNMVMMQGIQHFFSGFILLKVPFPLTVGFKHMFQKGIHEMSDLEPSYVSSISWYFLLMYGLGSFFKLIRSMPPLEQKEYDALQEKLGYQYPPPPNSKISQDEDGTIKLLRQELEQLELYYHTITATMAGHHNKQQQESSMMTMFDSVEKRLLGKQRYPNKKIDPSSIIDTSHFLLGGSANTTTSLSTKKKQ